MEVRFTSDVLPVPAHAFNHPSHPVPFTLDGCWTLIRPLTLSGASPLVANPLFSLPSHNPPRVQFHFPLKDGFSSTDLFLYPLVPPITLQIIFIPFQCILDPLGISPTATQLSGRPRPSVLASLRRPSEHLFVHLAGVRVTSTVLPVPNDAFNHHPYLFPITLEG